MTRHALRMAGLFAVLAVGCEGEPRRLGWELELEDTALLMRTRVVEATIREGGCAGDEIFATEVGRAGGGMALELPVLADGVYGFLGAARDEDCVLFAEGCTEVTLPTPGPVVVRLAARRFEVPACAASRCSDGFCGGVGDGGLGDGGCAATETRCADGTDDDCDGMTDCADDDCASSPGCDACSRITCGECEMCVDGMCRTADDGAACTGGRCYQGDCCTGCWDGGACVTGLMNDACGRAGDRCLTCEGCGSCASGACDPLPSTDGMSCGGGTGLCVGGACCTGCNMAGTCVPGDAPTACGTGGGGCRACAECNACTAGACAPMDGIACPGGMCRDGACCAGCWDGATCQPGTAVMACGTGGGMCNACLPCQRCEGGRCVPGADGDVCTSAGGLPGTCRGSPPLCCAGCWDGSDCLGGDDDAACGTRGMACDVCDPAQTCNGRFCGPML